MSTSLPNPGLQRFDADSWVAWPARGLMWFVVASIAAAPWFVWFTLKIQHGETQQSADQALAWMFSKYADLTRDFGWLLPMLLAVTLAFGYSNSRIKAELSLDERRAAAIRRIVPITIGVIGIEIVVFGTIAALQANDSEVSPFAAVLGGLAIAVTSIEVSHLIPTTPLRAQLKTVENDIVLTRRLLKRWRKTHPVGPHHKALIAANAVSICLASICIGWVASIWRPTNMSTLIILGVFFSLWCAVYAGLATRFRFEHHNKNGRHWPFSTLVRLSRFVPLLLSGLLVITICAAAVFGGDFPLASTCFSAFAIASTLGLWSGRRKEPSNFSRFVLGGLVRGKAYSDIERRLVRQKERRLTIERELKARRRNASTITISEHLTDA